MVSRSMFEDSVTDPMLYLSDGISELLHNCLTFQGLDGVRVGCSRHDDKGHNGGLGTRLLQFVVETCIRSASQHCRLHPVAGLN